ncbi:helix-turn-helix transcriptional regulator [Maridesulfovibrio bastinii]|uniref:helix-turn-helix transcriptional regulator n=1 Tax=Maridesulfovibrio bastinii TaxID=47157 RepID=UPI0003F690C3|nr:AlpA family phage regulatory protein [Maridesulfovibrio bastinii]
MKVQITTVKMPDTGFLRLPEVLTFIPISKSTWWDGIQKGKFPKGIKLTAGVTAWKVEDIRKLIEEFSHQEAA